MKYMNFLLTLLSVALIAGCSISPPDPDLGEWAGEYTYGQYRGGETQSGIAITVDYSVRIYEEDGNYYAELTADGWMLGEQIQAKVQGDNAMISLSFLSGHTQGEYAESDILLRFRKVDGALYTEWVAYNPHVDDAVPEISFKHIK